MEERKTIEETVTVTHNVDIDELIPVSHLKAIFEDCIESGATHLNIHGYSYDGHVEDIDIEGVKVRLETDEEYSSRLESERQKEENDRNYTILREMAELKRLKEKYERK